jgi:hypothetical protein
MEGALKGAVRIAEVNDRFLEGARGVSICPNYAQSSPVSSM